MLSLQDFQPNSWSLGTSVLVTALRCAMCMKKCKSREQLKDLYITHLMAFPKKNTINTVSSYREALSPAPCLAEIALQSPVRSSWSLSMSHHLCTRNTSEDGEWTCGSYKAI